MSLSRSICLTIPTRLIVIPTPNDTHFPLAKAALEAAKHVVVDKPFTVTLSGARAGCAGKALGRVLSVFHNTSLG
ncbi:Gfo/Idh/MocA family oxidoreductase [Escherichia coli]|uniref:Gfo/Idh/MocA family oxidoreductase n=1 Tax=Escherichia coli TaxID=562 RepID=UPI002237D714|nr:Gfo/Idh/MocA family oxidoreductase [Escherichia coli]